MSDYDYGLHALDQAFVTQAQADRQAAERARARLEGKLDLVREVAHEFLTSDNPTVEKCGRRILRVLAYGGHDR